MHPDPGRYNCTPAEAGSWDRRRKSIFRWQLLVSRRRVCSFLALSLLSALPTRGADIVLGGPAPPHTHRLAVNPEAMTRPWLQNLGRMPEDHSPSGTKWTNSVAVCAVMKDENVTDVREWLQYYQWLGVDHVFLFDNDSADKTIIDQLRPHFSSRFVTFGQDLRPKAQLMVYAWCIEEQRMNYNWIMFFDMDEYLVLRGNQKGGLKGLLNEYRHYGGLAVHWIFVGPGGRQTRPEHGGVLRSYTKCVSRPYANVKTIGNTWFLDGTAIHPHNHNYRDGALAVNENKEPLEMTWKLKPGVSKQRPSFQREDCPSQPERCMYVSNWQHQPPSVERVALFHYATKSYEDFRVKMQRGSGMSGSTKGFDYLNNIVRNETDDAICKEPMALADLCCRQSGTRWARLWHRHSQTS